MTVYVITSAPRRGKRCNAPEGGSSYRDCFFLSFFLRAGHAPEWHFFGYQNETKIVVEVNLFTKGSHTGFRYSLAAFFSNDKFPSPPWSLDIQLLSKQIPCLSLSLSRDGVRERQKPGIATLVRLARQVVRHMSRTIRTLRFRCSRCSAFSVFLFNPNLGKFLTGLILAEKIAQIRCLFFTARWTSVFVGALPEWCAIFQFSFATLVNSVFIGLLLTSLNIKIFHIANVILICAKRLFRVFGMFTDFKNILWGAIFLRLSVNTKKTKPYSYNLHRLRRRGGSVLFRSYISSPQNPKWAFCLCIFTQTTPPPLFFL